MGEIVVSKSIGGRPRQTIEKDTWDSLLDYQGFKDFASKHLAKDTKNDLKAHFAQIDEDEQKDYANPHAIKRNHTREEYNKFREEKTEQAIKHDLSRLDAKTLSDLKDDLASIDEDEQKDYASFHTINHSHTKKEYDKFREEAVAKAFQKIGEKVESIVTQPAAVQQEATVVQQEETASASQEDILQRSQTTSDVTPDVPDAAIEEIHNDSIDDAQIVAITAAHGNAIAKAESEAIERSKFKTAEELDREIARVKTAIASKKQKVSELKKAHTLVAINANFTHDKKELARDYAEQELNAENAKSNFIKRLWKGDLYKKYYWKKYEKEILEGKRQIHIDGESFKLDEIIKKRSDDVIKRFVMGVMDDPETSRFIHRNIGGKKGEKLVEADEETTNQIKRIIKGSIESCLKADLADGEFTDRFKEDLKQYKAEARDKKENPNALLLDNYAEVATIAYQLVRQHQSIDAVMEGFKVYNASVRNNQRTEAHRDKLDKIINKIESSAVGQVVPAEIIAGAVGSVYSLTQIGSRAIAGLGFGLGAAGAFSGLRERNRVTEDRTRMMRDAAEGLAYSQTDTPSELTGLKRLNARNRARYEARLGGTLYKIKPASELLSEIREAIKTENKNAIMHAIAESRVRIDYSDSEQKDLIAYSSADKMGKERLELDALIIGAEKIISESGYQENLDNIKSVIQKEIDDGIKASDKDFSKFRTAQSLKRAGKTIALGAVFALTAQEVVATISPSKIGIFEKSGLLRAKNNDNATETILARLTGPQSYIDEVSGITEGNQSQYEEAGYTITKTADAYTEVGDITTTNVGIEEVSGIKADIRWANNSTIYAEGNELGLHIDQSQGSFFTDMSGTSSLPSGEIINVADNIANGNAKLLVKIGGKTFESPSIAVNSEVGQAIFGQNGYITTTTGEVIRVIGDNGERLFDSAQLVIEDGIGQDLTHYFTSIAAVSGDGAIGTIAKTTQDIISHPTTYTATRIFQRRMSGSGFISPLTSRNGLGAPTSNERQ